MVAVPIIFVYLFLRLSETAFEMVGFSHWNATLAVFGSILGSLVDMPLMSSPVSAYPAWYMTVAGLSPQSFPTTFHSLYLAVNLGGCIIPLVISAHLLINRQASFGKSFLGMEWWRPLLTMSPKPFPARA